MKRVIVLFGLLGLIFSSCEESTEEPIDYDWNVLEQQFDKRLYQVEFLSDEIGFIGGFGGDDYYFAKTLNGGVTWDEIRLEPSNSFSQSWFETIYFINNQIGFVAIDDKVFKTTNQGEKWTEIVSENLSIGRFVFANADKGISFSNTLAARISYTIDGGDTWTRYDENNFPKAFTSGNIFITDVVFAENDDNVIFIGAKTGEVYQSTDGGLNWNLYNSSWMTNMQQSGQLQNIGGLLFKTKDLGYIFTDAGIFKTQDGGESFSLLNADSPSTSNGDGFGYLKISYLSESEVYLHGDKYLYIAKNDFQTIELLSIEENTSEGINTDVSDFIVLPSGKGYAVGYQNDYFKNEEYGVVLTYNNN